MNQDSDKVRLYKAIRTVIDDDVLPALKTSGFPLPTHQPDFFPVFPTYR